MIHITQRRKGTREHIPSYSIVWESPKKCLILLFLLFISILFTGCLDPVEKKLIFDRDKSGILVITITELDEQMADDLKNLTIPDPSDLELKEKLPIGSILSKQMKENIRKKHQKNLDLLEKTKNRFPQFSYSCSKINKKRIWILKYPFKNQADLLAFLRKVVKHGNEQLLKEYEDDEFMKAMIKQIANQPIDPFFETYKFKRESNGSFTFRCKLIGIGGLENQTYTVKMPAKIKSAKMSQNVPKIEKDHVMAMPPWGEDTLAITTYMFKPNYKWQYKCKIASLHNHAFFGDGGYQNLKDFAISLLFKSAISLYFDITSSPESQKKYWDEFYQVIKIKKSDLSIEKNLKTMVLQSAWLAKLAPEATQNLIGRYILSEKNRFTPGEALHAFKENGFKVAAITEHGLHLNRREWNETKKQINDSCSDDFHAIWGFEWTGTEEDLEVFFDPTDTKGPGHINVFDSVNFCAYRNGEENGYTPDVKPTLEKFYRWVLNDNNRNSKHGGLIVCQFNHPSLYDGVQGDPSSHFYDFKIPYSGKKFSDPEVKELQSIFALCEVGSHGAFISNIAEIISLFKHLQFDKAFVHIHERIGDGTDPNISNEYWFRKALNLGWRVAPTMSEDRHFGKYGEENDITGIWVVRKSNDVSDILEALRNRRTFVSEDDRTLKIKFWIEMKGKGKHKTYRMGETVDQWFSNSPPDEMIVNWHITSGEGAIGKVSVITIGSDSSKPLLNSKLVGKDFESMDYYDSWKYNNPPRGIRAIYLKVERPREVARNAKALGAPIFFSYPPGSRMNTIPQIVVSDPDSIYDSGKILCRYFKRIEKGQVKKVVTLLIKQGTGSFLVRLKWPGSKLELKLKDPRGKPVTKDYPGSHIKTDSKNVTCLIYDPLPGNWSIDVAGIETPPEGSLFEVFASLPEEKYIKKMGTQFQRSIKTPGKKVPKIHKTVKPKNKTNSFNSSGNIIGGSSGLGPSESSISDSDTFFYIISASIIFLIIFLQLAISRKTRRRKAKRQSPLRSRSPGPLSSFKEIETTMCEISNSGYLISEDGQFKFEIDKSPITIGRAADNYLTIKDLQVSSHHSIIRKVGNAIYIQDLNSTNGVYVNGKRVKKSILKDYDRITMGNMKFIYRKNG